MCIYIHINKVYLNIHVTRINHIYISTYLYIYICVNGWWFQATPLKNDDIPPRSSLGEIHHP